MASTHPVRRLTQRWYQRGSTRLGRLVMLGVPFWALLVASDTACSSFFPKSCGPGSNPPRNLCKFERRLSDAQCEAISGCVVEGGCVGSCGDIYDADRCKEASRCSWTEGFCNSVCGQRDIESCSQDETCQWSNDYGRCLEARNECDSIGEQSQCLSDERCIWTPRCGGYHPFTCRMLSSEESCEEYSIQGCYWGSDDHL